MWKTLLAVLIGVGTGISAVYAHPGGLQYDENNHACHACQTDCAKWKLSDGEVHVHYRADTYSGISFATYRNAQGQLFRAQNNQGVLVENDPRNGQPDPYCRIDNEEPDATPAPSELVSGTTAVAAAFQDIIISEILPRPAGTDINNSFIELRNTGQESIDLSGFWLSEEGGSGSRFLIPNGTSIGPGEYLVFFRRTTGITFPSFGAGSALFLAPNQNPIVKLMFDSIPGDDMSLIWDGTGYAHWTSVPTPGKENVFSSLANEIRPPAYVEIQGNQKTASASLLGYSGPPMVGTISSTAYPTNDIEQSGNNANIEPVIAHLHAVRSHPAGTLIQTKGIVSGLPESFGGNLLYLAGSGIGVILPEEGIIPIALGDIVRVTGILSETRNGMFLVLQYRDAIERLAEGPPPLPHIISIGDIGRQHEGFLVQLHGTIRDYSQQGFNLSDGERTVTIVFSPEMTWTELPNDSLASITGIVSLRNEELRIFPRNMDDISLYALEEHTPEPWHTARSKRWIGLGMFATAGILYSLTKQRLIS